MRIEGHAVCLPADIDTDQIIAGRYLRTKDRSVWKRHVFEDLDADLAERLDGAVIVAGKNFGCGSSREQAPVALKVAGVRAIVAPSFARIFFRNAINIGLPLAEAEILCNDGDRVEIDLSAGMITIAGKTRDIRPLSPRMLEMLAAGGLVSHWRQKR
ncbi:MAG: 3-isopropylmalate dehydratase [Methanoregulaceae archaeon]|jgi:methanogen homoaconitase small subunit|nr:3-isopropylmalate dehydratase [Methanoregulaceae archaeon]